MGFLWHFSHLVQTGSQTFHCLVSYEFFKHVFHRSILILLWCLPEVMVEVSVNRLNYHSCTKRGVCAVTGVIPVCWLPNLLWWFSNSKVIIFICTCFAFGFFQASHQFHLHRATQIVLFHGTDLFYNTDTKSINTKMKSGWLQEVLYVFWVRKKPPDLRITW